MHKSNQLFVSGRHFRAFYYTNQTFYDMLITKYTPKGPPVLIFLQPKSNKMVATFKLKDSEDLDSMIILETVEWMLKQQYKHRKNLKKPLCRDVFYYLPNQ